MSTDCRNISFEDELEKHGSFIYRNAGTSMLPLIRQGRDLMVIERMPAGTRCRKYDVVLYRSNGRYVLHRIVKVLPDSYVICGDNCMAKEYGITDEDILGVMTSMVRSGREVRMDARAPRLYARAWCALYPVRIGARKGKHFAGQVLRKAFKR